MLTKHSSRVNVGITKTRPDEQHQRTNTVKGWERGNFTKIITEVTKNIFKKITNIKPRYVKVGNKQSFFNILSKISSFKQQQK